MEDLGEKENESTPLFYDNTYAIALTKNPMFHECSKHVEIKHHYIQDFIEKEEIILVHYKTEEQIDDVSTKALLKNHFKKLRSLLGKGSLN